VHELLEIVTAIFEAYEQCRSRPVADDTYLLGKVCHRSNEVIDKNDKYSSTSLRQLYYRWPNNRGREYEASNNDAINQHWGGFNVRGDLALIMACSCLPKSGLNNAHNGQSDVTSVLRTLIRTMLHRFYIR